MTGPEENSEFCFPRISMFPETKSRETLRFKGNLPAHGIWRETVSLEGREGVKWELGFAFFRGWEMEFCALGLGFMKKIDRKSVG